MQKPLSDTLEGRLLLELSSVNKRIKELEGERDALVGLLLKVRREDLAQREVTRKNSVNRILMEKAILERAARGGAIGVRANDLWKAAREADFSLKESTFRSHLRRLKERGLLVSLAYGKWGVSNAASVS